MQREFASREALIEYVREQFPFASRIDDHISPTRGGRQAAERVLASIQPKRYGKTRNYLDGKVTRLSPYLRHGVLNLNEVRDTAMQLVDHRGETEKLISELGWRDYYQRVYHVLGEKVWKDQESYKTGYSPEAYQRELPDDIRAGQTGLACMDAFVNELYQTGYLHNHARMWMASYVVHFRKVAWQAGAQWFLEHLLDGDPASNNLSWQ